MRMALPENAKCVFQGKVFDTYQWEQKMFDGSVQIFEKVKQKPSADIIVITPENKFLILDEEHPGCPPFLGLVAGSGEEGEAPIDTAKRELLEEAGLVSDDWTLFAEYSLSNRIEYVNSLYIARGCRKVADQDLDGGEKISFREVDWKGFLDAVADPRFRLSKFAVDALRYVYQGKEEELKKIILGE